MKRQTIPQMKLLTTLCLLLISQSVIADNNFDRVEAGEVAQGGDTTHYKTVNKTAFSHPASNIPFQQRLDFKIGNGIFKKIWVPAPSSTTASDGLGPLYNARSCMQCHLRDGRGHTPNGNRPDDNAVSMFLRLSIPPQTAQQEQDLHTGQIGTVPDPVYGGQLQDFAITGLEAEGQMHVTYTELSVELRGGQTVQLRHPEYKIEALSYGPTHPDLMLSPRIAPAMIGLGLLENIKEQDLLALSDPEDRNKDGISGRPNWVWDQEQGALALGRFGWKAGHPTLNQQNNSAFNGDMGISTPYTPNPNGDCTANQTPCLNMPNGNSKHLDGLELSSKMNNLLLFYTRHIAVPARRNASDPNILAGKKAFYDAGCHRCHQPKFMTATTPELPHLSQQLIWPYTDLLLHDMGEGLADHRPEFRATGREWRTPPLWGIGLTKTVSGQTHLLHDGRARSLLEAILWHGGEAETAKQKVKEMPVIERQNLIKFLESL